jgi:VWFA-related protein
MVSSAHQMTRRTIKRARLLCSVLALTAAIAPVRSQPQTILADEVRAHTYPYVPTPSLTLRTQVEMVEVPVVVRDRSHKVVTGLRQSDFTILDAGKKQDITAFSVETFVAAGNAAVPSPEPTESGAKPAVPAKSGTPQRYVALCFDDLSTDPGSLMQAKAAAKQFVKTALAPGDRVAVVTTAWPKSTEFTKDVAAMLALIDKVNPNSRMSDDVSMACPPIRPYEAYLIVNNMDSSVLQAKVAEYRACAQNPPKPEATVYAMASGIWEHVLSNSRNTLRAVDSLVQGLATAPGRRMILLASSGFLSGNLETEEDNLIRKALRAGVVINALGARGLYTVVPGGDAATPQPAGRTPRSAQITELRIQGTSESAKDDGMAVLASGTGGVFFHNNNDLLHGFRELGMVPESMYVLGFSPGDVKPDGRFHSLKVRVNSGSGYSVQARMGYAAPKRQAPAQAPPVSKVDTEISAIDTLTDLPAHITWEADPQTAGVMYVAHIDLSQLKLATRQNRRVQLLTLVAVLRDAAGNMVAGQRSDVDLNLTEATFTRLVANGEVKLGLTVKAPPGTYFARGVLLDGIEGKMVTSSQQVHVR